MGDQRDQRRFARCIVLKTAQWALDCRTDIPHVDDFRREFLENAAEMILSLAEYSRAVRQSIKGQRQQSLEQAPICLHRSAVGIEEEPALHIRDPIRLVLTSPPYPGVHVLYHRWQVQGRRETPAAFWIANTLDGNGASFYTFGDRKALESYFSQAAAAFKSIAKLCNRDTWVVQMVAFSDPTWQLPRYNSVMEDAGFTEIRLPGIPDTRDGRVWRSVPNRKWYASQRGSTSSSNEVVLFHRVRR